MRSEPQLKPSETKNRNWNAFGPLMDQVLIGLGLGQKLLEWKALQRWPETVDRKISAHVSAVRVQQGVLWLQASSPHWVAEVTVRKQEILNKLNGGDQILKDLRFVGPWDGRRKR